MVLEEDTEAKQRRERDKISKKVVVRKLPPTFTKEDFLISVEPLADYNYFSFITADKSLGVHSFSRAYINFSNEEDVFIFRDQFDGYVFVDQKGHEYPAIVEYAPFPKIPKQAKHRPDPRCGTIDNDEDYLEFLESLKVETISAVPQIETMLEEIEKEEKLLKAASGCKTKTPLLEYVEQRASERMKMIERRKKRDIERKKSREEERKKRRETAKKREDMYNEDREKLRQRREQREKTKRDSESDKEKLEEHVNKETKSGDSCANRQAKSYNRYSHKNSEPSPVKTKRYSEVRRREEREKKSKIEVTTPETSKSTQEIDSQSTCVPINEMDDTVTEEPTEEPPLIKDSPKQNIAEGSDDRKDRCKDPRTGRRIRNKDRPDMQLYRPGQARMTSANKTSDDKKDGESNSSSSSPSQEYGEACKDEQGEEKVSYVHQEEDVSNKSSTLNKNHNEKEEKCEDRSVRGRKGYSYNHDRESRKIRSGNTEEGSQFKSKTFRRSGQE